MQVNPRTTANDLVKGVEEMSEKKYIFKIKQVFYVDNLKGYTARKKPMLQIHQNNGIKIFQ